MVEKAPCKGLCKEAFSYCDGYMGKNAGETKFLFILHHADSRISQKDLFKGEYATALFRSQTGKSIFELFKQSEFNIEDVYITNFFKCLLPHDRAPKQEEYEKCLSVLEKQVKKFKPKKVVVFGEKCYDNVIYRRYEHDEMQKILTFNTMIGRVARLKGDIPCLVSNHPGKIYRMPIGTRREHYRSIEYFLKNDS